jgi:6-phosphogluconolactonase
MHIEVLPNAADLAGAVADHVAGRIESTPGPFALGLAGGATPSAGYTQLAARRVDWDRVVLWLGDERWVPQSHPDSNAGMVRRTLTDSVGARLLAPDHTLGEPEQAAADYAHRLQEVLRIRDGLPSPEMVLLGLGDDGHTASLFPGTAALDERSRSYVANWVPSQESWRLTATLPLLWAALELIFVVVGVAKADVVAAIVDGGEPLPAGVVAAGAASVTWFLDEAAASELRRIPRSSSW